MFALVMKTTDCSIVVDSSSCSVHWERVAHHRLDLRTREHDDVGLRHRRVC